MTNESFAMTNESFDSTMCCLTAQCSDMRVVGHDKRVVGQTCESFDSAVQRMRVACHCNHWLSQKKVENVAVSTWRLQYADSTDMRVVRQANDPHVTGKLPEIC